MALDLQDQEEIENAKIIWNSWGKWIALSLVLAGIIFLIYVWRYQHQQQENAAASEKLAQFITYIQDKNEKSALLELANLQKKYASTIPATQATLMIAGQYFDKGKYKEAQKSLLWVQRHQKDHMIQAIVVLRLATLQLQQKQYDAALKTLTTPVDKAYQAQVLNLKGDILLAQGKNQDAHQAFESALKLLPKTEDTLRTYIEVKSHL